MLAKGFADVVIIDPAQGGKAYTSSEFAKTRFKLCPRRSN
jgi:hypothetical protein